MSMPSSRRRRGDERGESAGLELLLDLEALLAGDAAVVGADQLLAGQLVEALGEALAEPAAVGEDDRAACGSRISSRIAGWMAGQMLVRRSGLMAGPPGCCSWGRTSPRALMSSTGTMTCSSSGLRAPASTIVTSRSGPMPPRKRAIASSGRCVALRPMRWGGSAPSVAQCLEALEAQGEVGTALRAGDRVDLVDDDVLDAAQDLAGLARQEEVQALGGRDEDVGRVAGDLATVLGRGVAGAAGDRDLRGCVAEPLRREADAGQRRAQVALDVVGQGLERRDVQDADVAGLAALAAAGSGPGRGGRGRRGRRPGSCRSPSGRG